MPPLTALYKYTPQNEELTYTELLNLCEDFEFDLSNDQHCDTAKATIGQHECDEQGRIQDFYKGVSISKKLRYRNILGISSDLLLTIYILLTYMQKLEIYVSMCTVCKAP